MASVARQIGTEQQVLHDRALQKDRNLRHIDVEKNWRRINVVQFFVVGHIDASEQLEETVGLFVWRSCQPEHAAERKRSSHRDAVMFVLEIPRHGNIGGEGSRRNVLHPGLSLCRRLAFAVQNAAIL